MTTGKEELVMGFFFYFYYIPILIFIYQFFVSLDIDNNSAYMKFDLRKDIEDHYEEYWNEVKSFLTRKFWDSFSAEELEDFTSDILLKAIEKQEYFEYQGEKSPIRWLNTLAIRETLNKFHRASYMLVDSADKEENVYEAVISSATSQGEDLLSFHEKVMDYIEKELPDIERKVLLGFANGYSYEELSLVFDLPLGTIKSKIHIGRRKVMSQFKNIEL